MDAKTAPSANTDSVANATQDIAGKGHTLPHSAQAVKARAADAATAVAGKAGDMATQATTRIRSGVQHTSGRVADLMRRRRTGWAATGAGVTAAIAAAARWRHTHTKPRTPAGRAWRQVSNSTSRQVKRLSRHLGR
jgi:hypothetical protein